MARAFLPAGFGGEQPKRKRAKYGGRRKGARNRIAKLAGSRMIDAHGEQGDLQSWHQPFPTRAFADLRDLTDAFGLICVGNVSGRWHQATNGKSVADASTGMSRNMRIRRWRAKRDLWMSPNTLRLRPVPSAVHSAAPKAAQVLK